MWHVSSRSGVATIRTAIHLLLVTYRRTDGHRPLHRLCSAVGILPAGRCPQDAVVGTLLLFAAWLIYDLCGLINRSCGARERVCHASGVGGISISARSYFYQPRLDIRPYTDGTAYPRPSPGGGAVSQRVGYLGISKSTESKRVKLTNLTPAPPSIFHVYACSGVGLYRVTL